MEYALTPGTTYTIRAKRKNSNNYDIGFNSSCNTRSEAYTRTFRGGNSDSRNFTLYACDSSGGTVVAELVSGGTTLVTAEQYVEVESAATPTNTPTRTPTATNTPSPAWTPTATYTPTATNTRRPGDTPMPTDTPTPTRTSAPTGMPDCINTLSSDGSISGTWTSACVSTHRTYAGVHYARYYTFSLTQTSTATITLSSSTDPYLFLLKGSGKNGEVEERNDDINWPSDHDSRISRRLNAGDYTIEATTFGGHRRQAVSR